MVFISHPNRIHETAVNLAEGSRQSGVAAAVAAGGGSAAVAAAVRAAEIIYYKAIIASGELNGINIQGYRKGLYDLSGFYA